jgi:Ca2+-binding RTX toxin-like protein
LGLNKFTGGANLDTISRARRPLPYARRRERHWRSKGDTFDTIERVIGTKLGTLAAANTATILDGGDLDDTLISGDGADSLVGGLGTDTASYKNAAGPVIVDLLLTPGTYTAVPGAITGATAQGASTGGDLYSGIENATGSSFGDAERRYRCNRPTAAQATKLQGGLGDDFLEGMTHRHRRPAGVTAAAREPRHA